MKNNGARQSVISALVGVLISIIGAMIQFLMIYWILSAYGTAFNGFIRIATALSVLGGSAEGALGITTVVMLMKPMANNDWIEANEIYSTARKKYHKNIFTGSFLITLVAVLYPLEIILVPHILSNEPISWGINISSTSGGSDPSGIGFVSIWEMIGIIFVLGSKQVLSAGFFGIYENIIMADQKNGVRKVIVLFADTTVYGALFFLLNLSIDGKETMAPIIPFLVLIAYGPIRGFLMRLYVKRYYPWLKFYPDFNSYSLLRTSGKVWKTGLGQNLLINADMLILFVVLGTSGLRVTSMLSLYLIIGVNLRLILTNLLISFREYFIGVISKEGRLSWEGYSKYELYAFVVAGFAFIMMSITTPYVVTGLYGNLVANDLAKEYNALVANPITAINESKFNILMAEANAFTFMFSNPLFSTLYAASTAFIILFQGQTTLIQAKGRFGDVSKAINIIALIYALIELIIALSIVFFTSSKNSDYLVNVLTSFYIVKAFFMTIVYVYLWQYTWKHVTYVSTSKYVFSNLMSLFVPIVASVLLNFLFVTNKYTLFVNALPPDQAKITLVTFPLLIALMLIVGILGLASTLLLPLILRPKVALSLILSLPIIKQIIKRTKDESRLRRLQDENIDLDQLFGNQKDIILKAINGIEVEQDGDIDEWKFFSKYQTAEKPKIYKIKGVKKEIAEENKSAQEYIEAKK